MAGECSFDVRFTPNLAEMENAHNQALKELGTRYDFRGTRTTMEFDRKTLTFTLQTEDAMKLGNLREMLERRLSGRGLPMAAMSTGEPQPAGGGTVRQEIKLQQGIPEDKIPKITAFIKGLGLKVRTSIQGAEIRVFGKSRDDLQEVIAQLKRQQFGCALDFGNYR